MSTRRRHRRKHRLVVAVVGQVLPMAGILLPSDPAPVPDPDPGVVDTTTSWPITPPVEVTQVSPPVFELP